MNDLKIKFSNKISSSQIIEDPFDHLYIRDFFEDDFYNEIQENIPDIKSFDKILNTGTVSKNYSPERYIFSLQRDLDKIPKKQKDFWNQINNGFLSKEFWEATSSKFSETLKERFENLTKAEKEILGKTPKISCRTALIKDFTKYQLGAHTDSINKIFSFLFYLPSSNKIKDIGTSLYQPKEILDEKILTKHFTREETKELFQKVKTCEFNMNSVFVFARNNYSFHGVEEINIEQSERNLFLVNFYGSKN